MGVSEHKKDAPRSLRVAVVTVSTSRGLAEDKSGQWMSRHAKREGHTVLLHEVVPDDRSAISRLVEEIIEKEAPDLMLVNGGTGLSDSDVTIEAVSPLFDKEISAFGPLFTSLSFESIDSAAMVSRAAAGIIQKTIVFCLPGSINACKLACKSLIFPEAGHIAGHLRS
jgi:molybdenum cofactor biosynthesis protein B